MVLGYLMLAFPSTLIILIGSVSTALTVTEPVFRPVDEIKTYKFIENWDLERPIVLSSFETGNNLPAWIPARVVLGHGPESIGNNKIGEDLYISFSGGTNQSERFVIWEYYNVDYLFWGPLEMGQWDYKPWEMSELNQIYNEGDYSIFELLKNK